MRLRFSASTTMAWPRSCTRASISAAKARWRSSPTCVPTARASPTRRCGACASTSRPNYGEAYLPAKPNFFASGKSAQEAHEAIRPTDLAYTPRARRSRSEAPTSCRLYTLIYNRFVASPDDAGDLRRDQRRSRHGRRPTAGRLFKAQGKILKFDGYRRVLAPAASRKTPRCRR